MTADATLVLMGFHPASRIGIGLVLGIKSCGWCQLSQNILNNTNQEETIKTKVVKKAQMF